MGAFATKEDVASILGGNITVGEIDVGVLTTACTDIEVASGVFQSDIGELSASNVKTVVTRRDIGWLKRAACFQYRFRLANPDIDERMDLSSASQDGESMAIRVNGAILGTMAQRCLKRLTWQGSRTLDTAGTRRARRLDDNSDPYEGWVAFR